MKKYIKYGYLLLAVPVFFLIRYYYYNDPEVASGEGLFVRCPFHLITGFHCPGCGSQRAVHDLLHFRIGDALAHNVMMVVVVLILLSKVYAFITKRYAPSYYYNLGHKSYFTIGLIILVFSYWILRNIPMEPFTHLAP